jgi:hypothetical protein
MPARTELACQLGQRAAVLDFKGRILWLGFAVLTMDES